MVHCIVVFCIILYYAILYYVVLYCIVLYCIVLFRKTISWSIVQINPPPLHPFTASPLRHSSIPPLQQGEGCVPDAFIFSDIRKRENPQEKCEQLKGPRVWQI